MILRQARTLGMKVVPQDMRCRHGILQSKAGFPLLQTISSEDHHAQDNLQFASTVYVERKNPVRSPTSKHSLMNSITVQAEFKLNILNLLDWFSTESRGVHLALLVSTQFWRRDGFIGPLILFVRN